jgi:hypothetical protein
VNADHDRIIDKVLKSVQHSSGDYVSDWIWDPKQHRQEDIKTKGDCCFNHIIGFPRKDGIEKPKN